MQRAIVHILVLSAVIGWSTLVCCPVALGFVGYEIGVSDTKEYQEMVFVSGKPTLLKGTVKATVKAKDNTEQLSLTYKLEDKSGGKDKLSRSVKLTSRIEKRGSQEVRVTSLDGFSESLTLSGKQYKLSKDSVFFNGSEVLDHQAVIDYTTGNWYMKKVYEVGRREGQVTVEMTGESDGYFNAWGRGETRSVEIRLEGKLTTNSRPPTTVNWQGSALVVMNDTSSRILEYVESNPQLVSFTGGFVDRRQASQILKISYDLPAVSGDTISDQTRNRGDEYLTLKTPPETKRLFVKECRDLRGHWARSAIESLCGLGAFEVQGSYFYPGVAMRRGEFIKALMVVGEVVPVSTSAGTATAKKLPPEEPVFLDVDNTHPYFKYIQAAYRKGIVQGNGAVFSPNAQLTRAEAIAIMVKAMGLENLAPTPAYTTGYYDDAQIPLWAKDAVYVATNYGLVKGETVGGNRLFRPLDIVTRAEAASLLDQFRIYLNQDFSRDRERIYRFPRTKG